MGKSTTGMIKDNYLLKLIYNMTMKLMNRLVTSIALIALALLVSA